MAVIVNGDTSALIASVSSGTKAALLPITAKQKIARRNELKEKSTLLLAILDEHLLKIHGIKDAKTLWEAIKTRNSSANWNFLVKLSLRKMQSKVAEKSTISLEPSYLDHVKQI
nr:hypothetical protein [Tanacetum cinerariifolium]